MLVLMELQVLSAAPPAEVLAVADVLDAEPVVGRASLPRSRCSRHRCAHEAAPTLQCNVCIWASNCTVCIPIPTTESESK